MYIWLLAEPVTHDACALPTLINIFCLCRSLIHKLVGGGWPHAATRLTSVMSSESSSTAVTSGGGDSLAAAAGSSRLAERVVFRNGKTSCNRFAVASLTNTASNEDGTLNDRELRWLERRARDGWGIVNTCCVHVQANGQGWAGEWGLFSDVHTEGYARCARAVKAHGSLLIVQIFHAGMRADDKVIGDDQTVVSCVDTVYKHRKGQRVARALKESEIEELIEAFVTAARRVEAAGADGIEIHAAHGYILTQFLCGDLNTRSDEWGGPSLANRARLIREVTRRVRAAVSDSFIVGIRLSPEPGYDKAGWNMDPDENVQVAQWCAEDGVDFVSVSIFGDVTHITPKHRERPDAKPLVRVFRDALPSDVVLMACGGVRSAARASAVLDVGADVVVCGKTSIFDPAFPRNVLAEPNYEVPTSPPYTREFLRSVDVSEPFFQFLCGLGLATESEEKED